ncbi:uncharacterized protein LOC143609148 [Bidens hawaiensis]|uniref:uncharacterized protein LOC143609148 n=1 Tax=Bidens hawaiensis TaxID=980011 RepID=UPI00404B62AF
MSQYPSLKAQDRPDIIARVFHMKVKSLLNFLKTRKPFGPAVADLYTIEFQKRGLPHCHLLLWVAPSSKITNPQQIDNYILAEIPDPSAEPQLHKVAFELMMHGPCGIARPSSPCMKGGSCSKSFLKDVQQTTSFDKNGYARYRRKPDTHTVRKNDVALDNRYVMPYNRLLCLQFQTHINVEYCGWSMLIKYLFKYISKGADRVRYTITRSPATLPTTTDIPNGPIDEIKNFLDARFICPHEASWRILNFVIHNRNPAVQVLSVHLEGMQRLTFRDSDRLDNVLRNPYTGKTTLTDWLRNNRYDNTGRHLRYVDYLSEYKWDATDKCWIRRSTRKTPAIGRLIYIHPTCGETFYLRMLLAHQRGCQTFEDIRTIAGYTYPTFRDACEKLGLLGNDNEWSDAFTEASSWATASELRSLFAHMLLHCEVSSPLQLWNTHWHQMADDGTHTHGLLNTEDLKQYVLYELELLLRTASPPSSLTEFALPLPEEQLLRCIRNKLLLKENNYDREALPVERQTLRARLNLRQSQIYEHVTLTWHLIVRYLHSCTAMEVLEKLFSGTLSSPVYDPTDKLFLS